MPREKHHSIYRVQPVSKQVKKQKEIRHFSKPRSVFAKWREDTQKVLDLAYDTDMRFTKCHKFIKDEEDRRETFAVVKKYYPQLKN